MPRCVDVCLRAGRDGALLQVDELKALVSRLSVGIQLDGLHPTTHVHHGVGSQRVFETRNLNPTPGTSLLSPFGDGGTAEFYVLHALTASLSSPGLLTEAHSTTGVGRVCRGSPHDDTPGNRQKNLFSIVGC